MRPWWKKEVSHYLAVFEFDAFLGHALPGRLIRKWPYGLLRSFLFGDYIRFVRL